MINSIKLKATDQTLPIVGQLQYEGFIAGSIKDYEERILPSFKLEGGSLLPDTLYCFVVYVGDTNWTFTFTTLIASNFQRTIVCNPEYDANFYVDLDSQNGVWYMNIWDDDFNNVIYEDVGVDIYRVTNSSFSSRG